MEPIFDIDDVNVTRPPELARVESLPAEIRRSILFCTSSLEDLRALVLASRVYHDQYSIEKKRFLCQALRRCLGNALVDAYAVQDATSTPHTSPEAVRSFLESYATLRAEPSRFLLEEHTAESDVVSMVAFYFGCMRGLPDKFAALFHERFEPPLEVGALSAAERTRLLRGLYRFHLYCILFANVPFTQENAKELESRRASTRRTFSAQDKTTIFTRTFPPWETEEISSVHHIVKEKYNDVLEGIKHYYDRQHPRWSWWNGQETPPGAWPYPSIYCDHDYAEGISARGLQVVHQILNAESNDKLVEIIDAHWMSSTSFFFSSFLEETMGLEYGDDDTDNPPKIDFISDTDEAAPLAWVRMANGRYRSWGYGECVSNNLKESGIMFWDSKRLDRTSLKEDDYMFYNWFQSLDY